MKTSPVIKILFFSMIIFGCDRCKQKDPNPCEGVPTSTAAFRTYEDEVYFGFKNYYDQDKFRDGVNFEAIDSTADSFEWKVGVDPRKFTKRKFGLTFLNTGEYDVTLKVRKKKNSYSCFANDDSVKTYSKKIKIIGRDNLLLPGKWRGVDTINPLDTFTVTIGKWYVSEGLFPDLYLKNYPNGCLDTIKYQINTRTYNLLAQKRRADFENCTIGDAVIIANVHKNEDTITILKQHYQSNKLLGKFIGKRL